MMEPIEALARFMAGGEDVGLKDAFAAEGVVIVENFAPFVFEGRRAFERWRDGFLLHVEAGELSGLEHRFGEAQDFAQDGATVYFVLPTTWTGKSHGRPFSEDGGWAFVLEQAEGRWCIRSYAWAVIAKR
jgi:hypothetical protein